MIEHLGERPLAVASIIRSIYIFLYISISAYSTAVNTMVSAKIGAGESASVAARICEVVKLLFSYDACPVPYHDGDSPWS